MSSDAERLGSGALDLQSEVHRRFNPLTGEWVLVSAQRTARPWQGQSEPTPPPPGPAYDPDCYLCPGNRRASGAVNPAYRSTFVFDNDFAALHPPATQHALEDGLLRARAESGVCRVVCYSPRHDLTLGQMQPAAIRSVIDTWIAQCRELAQRGGLRAVTIFENRGAMMGASNPHPHGQIWANETVPPELEREDARQRDWLERTGRILLCDYVALESERRERLVIEQGEWVALVPFWAVWPFETLVVPRHHAPSLERLSDAARNDLAQLLSELCRRYDALFGVPFPYTMGVHQCPTEGGGETHWQVHLHFYPPLLRSATVRKFMVGYEMLAGPQRDITAETAARRLREAVPTP
jgi:UDPglucose--hexose-1-phosphate uridylyltransferase